MQLASSQKWLVTQPLYVVASTGDEAVIQLLLDNGADINAMDPGDDTALHLAADGGHEAVLRILLENGADSAFDNYFGIPVLHSAAHDGRKGVLQLLLEDGADMRPKMNQEPLHYTGRPMAITIL